MADDVGTIAEVDVAGAAGARSGSLRARLALTWSEVLLACLAFLLTIAFGVPMANPSWTPRLALVLIAAPIGVVVLVRFAMAGQRAAQAAAAFGAWVVIAGFVSGAPRSALVGFVGRDLSAVLVVSCLGLWALGRTVGPRGRRAIVAVTLAGMGLSFVVAAAQLALDVRSGNFALNGGRPAGLTSNPVYFGGLMVGAAAMSMVLGRSGAGRRSWWLVPVALFSAGVAFSGSRIALGVLAIVVVVCLALWRTAALAPTVAAIAGFLAGGWYHDRFGAGRDALARVSSEAGLDGRREAWRYGWDAFLERPLFGWGFGRFQTAVQEHFTPEFVVDYARDDIGVAWFDAHNLIVGIVVAVGLPGVVLAGTWIVLAARRLEPATAAFVGAVAFTWLLQPPALATLPLVMLLFGVSGAAADLRDPPDVALAGLGRTATATLVGLGLLLGTGLIGADLYLRDATRSFEPERSERAAAWFPGDPVVAGLVAQVWAIDTQDFASSEAIEWQRRAVDRDPERPYWRARLAERLIVAGELEEAAAELDAALELQPNHYLSVRLRVVVARELGDAELSRSALEHACRLEAPECVAADPSADEAGS